MTVRSGRAGPAAGRHQSFLAFAERHRVLLSGCALLLVGDVQRAGRLTESVLARRYLTAAAEPASLVAALQEVVRPRPGDFDPPWTRATRVELVDTAAPAPADPLLVELQRLPVEQRASLVLDRYAGLGAPLVADALRADVATVEMWAQQAHAVLAAGRPERQQPGRIAEELRAVVQRLGHPVPADSGLIDLAHGRSLVRRRRARHAAALLAAVLVVVLGAVTVVRAPTAPPSVSEPPVVAPSAPLPTHVHPGTVRAACDIKNPSCQATVMRRWRDRMGEVTLSHLDPDRSYFTGYTFSYDPRYESPSFWAGRGGALGLEVFRVKGGATEVYLQIATGYQHAVRCGQTTKQTCASQRFMDGNRFSLSASTVLSDGLEVQHRPDGDQVITVVARNTARGSVLELTRGDLVDLIQDPRLRLPEI